MGYGSAFSVAAPRFGLPVHPSAAKRMRFGVEDVVVEVKATLRGTLGRVEGIREVLPAVALVGDDLKTFL